MFIRYMFTLEEGIRKMTSLPAESAGLLNRGRIESGKTADIVILDQNKLADNSTDREPNAYPSGVDLVIVNGQVVLNKNERTDILPGRIATH